MILPIRLRGKDLKPHKATVAPLIDARTVLTNSPWEFVSLWLSREGKKNALFYWNQAHEFARASTGIGLQSSPLLHYYSFMNAAKALLEAKNINFHPYHGATGNSVTSKRIDLKNEVVRIKPHGILPSLAEYLDDSETEKCHTLKDLMFNLPYIHRTYCLTYPRQPELFFPLSDCRYVFDTRSNEAYLRGRLSSEFSEKRHFRRLPATFVPDTTDNYIRSAEAVMITSSEISTPEDVRSITCLNQQVRKDLNYINAAETLWYAKATVSGSRRLRRSPLTMTLAAMHRLSEICRYRPLQLQKFLTGHGNWLLNEFVTMAPQQFIDGIAAELTGHQFMLPNVRPAS